MATVFKTNTVTFVPLIVAFKVMSISNELVMTDFEIDHANNVTDHSEIALGDTYNDCRQAKDNFTNTDAVMIQSIVSMIYSIVILHYSIVVLHCSNVGIFYYTIT
jgi:hypothetical protein